MARPDLTFDLCGRECGMAKPARPSVTWGWCRDDREMCCCAGEIDGAGEGVSYKHMDRATRHHPALLPIGYADGAFRPLAGG